MTPPIRRVLVPTDFSPESDAALALAKTIAAGYGASLLLLHVFEEIGGVFAGDAYAPLPPETRAALLKDARARLTHRLSPEERTRFRATADVIVGASAPKIIDYASQQHVDLIVMGTHGRTGMAHLLMGSIAERVVRLAPCPVLTVHHNHTVARESRRSRVPDFPAGIPA